MEEENQTTDQKDIIEVKKNTLIVGIVLIGIIIVGFYLGGIFMGGDTANSLEYVKETPLLVSLDDEEILGSGDSVVSFVEFSDFHCPYCGMFYVETVKDVKKNYVEAGKINFVHRDLPLLSIHPDALKYAEASECAGEQGKFWEIVDVFYTSSYDYYSVAADQRGENPFTIEKLQEYGEEVELDMDLFNSCLDSGEMLLEIQGDLDDGGSYGITGAPASFIVARKEISKEDLEILNSIAVQINTGRDSPLMWVYNGKDVTTVSISGAMPYSIVSGILDVLV